MARHKERENPHSVAAAALNCGEKGQTRGPRKIKYYFDELTVIEPMSWAAKKPTLMHDHGLRENGQWAVSSSQYLDTKTPFKRLWCFPPTGTYLMEVIIDLRLKECYLPPLPTNPTHLSEVPLRTTYTPEITIILQYLKQQIRNR